jgi:hypothetical protein
MTTDNFCFYLQNRPIPTSQTGGQWYSDTFPFSIPWINILAYLSGVGDVDRKKGFIALTPGFSCGTLQDRQVTCF